MKNIVLALGLLLSGQIYSQVYSLDSDIKEIPKGAYFKDTKNELMQYVGTWKGTWEGKTLILDLRRVKYNYDNYYEDRIAGERKVINQQGVVEIDRISNFDNQKSEIKGILTKPKNPNIKQLSFYPKDMCNKSASLDIHFLNAEKTQMRLIFHYDPSWNFGDCKHQAYVDKYGDYPMNFPKDIVLIKQ